MALVNFSRRPFTQADQVSRGSSWDQSRAARGDETYALVVAGEVVPAADRTVEDYFDLVRAAGNALVEQHPPVTGASEGVLVGILVHVAMTRGETGVRGPNSGGSA